MGQEPYTYDGKIRGMPNQHQLMASSEEGPRAFILAHKFIPLLLDNENSDKDTCNALWVTNDKDIHRINLVSSYWDGNNPELPAKLVKSVESGKARNNELIISMDSNAHSDVYGSGYTDARGAKLEQFILEHNLEIVNEGNEYTFESGVGKSVIDITRSKVSLVT